MRLYLTSSKFKHYTSDWLCVLLLLVVFFGIVEKSLPFNRQFSINDLRLSHPFATEERVTDIQLYLLTCIAPSVLVTLISLFSKNTNFERLHSVQIANLGLWLVLSITGVLTDILKCWIGNPRPDFIERCSPVANTPVDKLVDISVCTAPLGQMYLLDGLKSTPSGHSSLSFAGLGYLALWLCGHYKILSLDQTSHAMFAKLILAVSPPILLAAYIALSRTQDYRHHFFDVIFGSIIGTGFAYWGYFRHYPSLFASNSNIPLDPDEETWKN